MAYDWDLIKREYIRGYVDDDKTKIPKPTLKQLSERHGCRYDYLRSKASPKKENWEQKRHIYHTKITQKTDEKEIEIISDESVNLDSLSLDTAKDGITLIKNRLNDKEVSNHDIPKLTGAFTDLLKGYKLLLGEPTEHIKEESTQKKDINFNTTNQSKILEEEGYDK